MDSKGINTEHWSRRYENLSYSAGDGGGEQMRDSLWVVRAADEVFELFDHEFLFRDDGFD